MACATFQGVCIWKQSPWNISFINGWSSQSRNKPEKLHTNPGIMQVAIKVQIYGSERWTLSPGLWWWHCVNGQSHTQNCDHTSLIDISEGGSRMRDSEWWSHHFQDPTRVKGLCEFLWITGGNKGWNVSFQGVECYPGQLRERRKTQGLLQPSLVLGRRVLFISPHQLTLCSPLNN